MKHIITYLSLIVLLLFVFSACSDIKEDLSGPVTKAGVHPEGMADAGSENFHGVTLKNSNWDLKDCQRCHASDYSGGFTGANCLTCHTQPSGPEACNTCHGSFANPERIAPPNDLAGNNETSEPGVGAHSQHLHLNEIGPEMTCATCHNMDAPGTEPFVFAHIDALPADMKFGGNAILGSALASYDFTNNTCANTYCHGNFTFNKADAPQSAQTFYIADAITGMNQSPVWTAVDNTYNSCGNSCHANPPAGHIEVPEESCGNCHGAVADNYSNIIDKSKHMNGKVNVFGIEY